MKTAMPENRLLHLSARDIESLALAPRAALDALEAALRDPAVFTVPKVPLPIAPGHFFQAMPVASRALGFAAVKWVAVAAANPAQGMPGVQARILLNDLDNGRPVATMAGDRLTALRTAAMTACAARRLARADSATIAFIGCGVQARAHLAALRDVLPALRRAAIVGRGADSTAAFRDHVAATGLEVAIAEPRAALVGADVVVSTVMAGADLRPFLDGEWLVPGAFAALVDRGAPWLPGSLDTLDLVATDDRAQSQALAAEGKLAHRGPWAADLAELARADAPLRRDAGQRTAFVFAGLALADLAVAALAFRRAQERGIGTVVEA